MKLLTVFILLHLFACVPADIDGELRRSIEIVMKCQYRDPPTGPVIAVSPSRFAQIVVILHERFQTPACGRSLNSPIHVNDERTWPFCVFGRCVQDKCHCAGHFSGPKCSIYTKKCWLMYCYLTSCHPTHQSLHCICDPSLYGTRITSGIYWYNEGRSSKYIPPPPGWKDDPTNLMQWKGKGDSAIGNVSSEQKQLFPNVMPEKNGVQLFNAPSSSGGIKNIELPSSQAEQNMREFYPKAVASVPGFDSAGRVSGTNLELPSSQAEQNMRKLYPKAVASVPGFDSAGRVSGTNLELPSSQIEQNMREFYPKAVASVPGFDSAGRVSGTNLELPSSQAEQNMRKFYPKVVASVPEFDSAGRVSGTKAKYRENTAGNRISELKTEKSDIEKALEELEEVSAAMNLNTCNIYVIVLILLSVNFLLDAAAG